MIERLRVCKLLCHLSVRRMYGYEFHLNVFKTISGSETSWNCKTSD
jgi:hypothetical protein